MKNLKNLGQALTKAEQKTISGGLRLYQCGSDEDCGPGPHSCPAGGGYFIKCYQSACMIDAC